MAAELTYNQIYKTLFLEGIEEYVPDGISISHPVIDLRNGQIVDCFLLYALSRDCKRYTAPSARIIVDAKKGELVDFQSAKENPFSVYDGTDYFESVTNIDDKIIQFEEEYQKLYITVRAIAFKKNIAIEETEKIVRYIKLLKIIERKHLIPFLFELGTPFFQWAKKEIESKVCINKNANNLKSYKVDGRELFDIYTAFEEYRNFAEDHKTENEFIEPSVDKNGLVTPQQFPSVYLKRVSVSPTLKYQLWLIEDKLIVITSSSLWCVYHNSLFLEGELSICQNIIWNEDEKSLLFSLLYIVHNEKETYKITLLEESECDFSNMNLVNDISMTSIIWKIANCLGDENNSQIRYFRTIE